MLRKLILIIVIVAYCLGLVFTLPNEESEKSENPSSSSLYSSSTSSSSILLTPQSDVPFCYPKDGKSCPKVLSLAQRLRNIYQGVNRQLKNYEVAFRALSSVQHPSSNDRPRKRKHSSTLDSLPKTALTPKDPIPTYHELSPKSSKKQRVHAPPATSTPFNGYNGGYFTGETDPPLQEYSSNQPDIWVLLHRWKPTEIKEPLELLHIQAPFQGRQFIPWEMDLSIDSYEIYLKNSITSYQKCLDEAQPTGPSPSIAEIMRKIAETRVKFSTLPQNADASKSPYNPLEFTLFNNTLMNALGGKQVVVMLHCNPNDNSTYYTVIWYPDHPAYTLTTFMLYLVRTYHFAEFITMGTRDQWWDYVHYLKNIVVTTNSDVCNRESNSPGRIVINGLLG
ncbi:hypothetical protein IWQ62_002426 [Dispira parvispora]|uniref:Uncharacterized protein n=1 Tax=Dispira parvispora TaxID=1520584 RepID=A0A9W8E2P8_9FUNG|nr:hypothetical protein IWQ62_002426 [Dispira parvispora]